MYIFSLHCQDFRVYLKIYPNLWYIRSAILLVTLTLDVFHLFIIMIIHKKVDKISEGKKKLILKKNDVME